MSDSRFPGLEFSRFCTEPNQNADEAPLVQVKLIDLVRPYRAAIRIGAEVGRCVADDRELDEDRLRGCRRPADSMQVDFALDVFREEGQHRWLLGTQEEADVSTEDLEGDAFELGSFMTTAGVPGRLVSGEAAGTRR